VLISGSYAEAIDVACFLAGEVTEVTSSGDVESARLFVHHRIESGAIAEVRVQGSATELDRWSVVVDCQRGRLELSLDHGLDGPAWLRIRDEQGVRELSHPSPGLPGMIVSQFRAAIGGERHEPTWSNATRAAELADWAWYSLDRRRAVDVFREEHGELASFKGRMTAIGCGLIWLTLFVLIVIAVGKGLHWPGMDLLAVVTVLIWSVFLLFQALRWTLPKSDRPRHNSGSASASALR
jgi:hypothetical protein